jgi:hypothetical protein
VGNPIKITLYHTLKRTVKNARSIHPSTRYYQQDKKRKLCKRRAAIEPIIGHLKSDFRLSMTKLSPTLLLTHKLTLVLMKMAKK